MTATGPTTGFTNAYDSALAGTAAGPFVVDLTVDLSSIEDTSRAAFVAGAEATLSGGKVQLTENPVEMYYARFTDGSFHLGPLFTPFHMTLGGTSVSVAGLELHGKIDDACHFVPDASATLYLSESQSGVALGGSTLGTLLGTKNFDVTGGSGTNNGWAIPLSGDAAAVRLP